LLAETTESIVAMVLWLSSTTTGTTTPMLLLGLLLSWGTLTRAFSLPIIAVTQFGTSLVCLLFFLPADVCYKHRKTTVALQAKNKERKEKNFHKKDDVCHSKRMSE
jgi:hypothetical protein